MSLLSGSLIDCGMICASGSFALLQFSRTPFYTYSRGLLASEARKIDLSRLLLPYATVWMSLSRLEQDYRNL